jgi:Tat protein secretion system quality control protein TatD with DNase activity
MAALNIAVVGAGVIGRAHMAVIASNSRCQLCAVADPTDAAQAWAQLQGVASFNSLEALLATTQPDGVILATPNAWHVSQVLQCIAAGVPVLVEKPVAHTVAEAQKLVQATQAHQAKVLKAQLELAVELKLNVILHNRESWDDLTALVLPFSEHLRGVFHCFTGTMEQAAPLLKLGHLISFTGVVSFKNAGVIAEAARVAPADGYMIETDAPYLAPVPHRGKRCEPAYVADTASAIAALRGESIEQVAADTTRIALAFFRGWD